MKLNNNTLAILAGGLMLSGAAGAAQPQAKFYGLLDLWAGSIEKPADQDNTAQLAGGGMSTSFLGARVDYKVNDDVTVFGVAEMFLRPDTGEDGRYNGDEFFGRNAYIGASSQTWGELKAGRTKSPFFIPMVITNSVKDSFAFSPMILHTYNGGNGGAVMGDTTWNDSLNYTTPSFGGLKANLVYAFGEEEGESGENKVGGNLIYRQGGLVATVAATRVREGTLNNGGGAGERGNIPGATDQDAAMAGLSYNFGVATLYGQYMTLETDTTAGDVDTDTWQAGVAVPVGPGNALASYANSDFSGAVDYERNTWSAGYDYVVSSQLDLYAMYLHDDIDDVGTGSTYGVGARFKF
ncbi:MAG: porin [Alcanivorax sp.]|uniref:porin n=1 Tax=Alloalcanivorax marinus TaxID=1177169 RepID=UPI001959C0FC|nr:porin [Alloalcanivorax marinus]MBM7332763.1 porin [Alloalcanivorax marinus]MCU5787600.1 porin transmembrane protein [Alloalcanivorax marinus]